MIQLPDVDNLPRDPDVLLEVIRGMCVENGRQQKDVIELKIESDRLKTESAERHQNIIELTCERDKYKSENAWLRELVAARNRKLFGRKSEKLSAEECAAWLFNEAELAATANHPPIPETGTVTVVVRRRGKKGRKPIADSLPRKIIEHDLSAQEKLCGSCGGERPRLAPDISEEIEYIPAQVHVNRHVYHNYGPCACGGTETTVVGAVREKRILPGSVATPSLLSFLATSKFCDGLPFYRMEKMFTRLGVEYPRATMCNQMIGLSRSLQGLLDLMWKDLLDGSVIRMDETRLQVLHEPGREASQPSWMHVAVGGTGKKRIVLFHYHATRKHDVPVKILEGWSGYLQTDGLAAYNGAGEQSGIIHVGCWGHARRKFIDARGGPKAPPGGIADDALVMIGRLYTIERTLREKGLDDGEFVKQRRAQAEPVLDELKIWLDDHLPKALPQNLLFEAMRYMKNEWKKLKRYLDHAELRPDNNITENAQRPFVIGRKNWLFANAPLGAHASATLYSIIETAKANGLEPYAYMKYVFTVLPGTSKENLSNLLPHKFDPSLIGDNSTG
jgi:transposase